MNLLNYVENSSSSEFYPTPKALVERMLEDIAVYKIDTVLEPSAGKGDILKVLAEKANAKYYEDLDVDCIELDANLRQILKYNFSEDRKYDISSRLNKCRRHNEYDSVSGKWINVHLSADEEKERDFLECEERTFFAKGIHIIHDNFLTLNTYKKYDLIIMNPPFSEGDKHLLKAIDMQKNGGNIICLLNAETIKNPYTRTRQELVRLLEHYNANIEYVEGAFDFAERTANVEVAIIKIFIEEKKEDSDIYNRMREATREEEYIFNDVTDLEITDFIKSLVNRYNIEVKSGLELIRQYKNLIPYMPVCFGNNEHEKAPILQLTVGDRNRSNLSENEFIETVRSKYWEALLANPKFTGKLTSSLQTEYKSHINKLKNYDFSEFNIMTLSAEMNARIKEGVEIEIEKMYDRLTIEHTYGDFSKNIHLYDGWKTNKAHKIEKKVIIPCYGVFDSWDGKPRCYQAHSLLCDIERILNFLDGNMTQEIDLYNQLQKNFELGITKDIYCKYFKVTFYKKGTAHLTFINTELIDRYNIYIGKLRNWLPPSYGTKKYSEMNDEEKTVIDNFCGEEKYNKVLKQANYYLAPAISDNILLLKGA